MPKIYYDQKGFPVYDEADGWKNYSEFQAAALNDMDKIAARKQKQQTSVKTGGTANASQFGRVINDALPTVGAFSGGLIDPLGGEVGGALAGTLAKQYLRGKYPETFGENPSTTMGQIHDLATDVGLSSIPALGPVAKIAKNASTGLPLIGKIAGPTAQALEGIMTNPIIKQLTRAIQIYAKKAPEPSEQSQNPD